MVLWAAFVPSNHGTEASLSAQQRKELLFKSLKVTVRHPLFGVGPGNFEVVSGAWDVTHNSYTQISAEGGIPAFFCRYLSFGVDLLISETLENIEKQDREFGYSLWRLKLLSQPIS